jgi:formylglycine-generating enzyme
MRTLLIYLIGVAPLGAIACSKANDTTFLREVVSASLTVSSARNAVSLQPATGGLRTPQSICNSGMVEFRSNSGQRFCMDATEVTQAAYAAFLDTANVAQQDAHDLCSQRSNPEFSPRTTAPCTTDTDTALLCGPGSFAPKTMADQPVVCVDFCDAVAYCAASGKRLCGSPGEKKGRTLGDGRNDTGDFALAGASSDRSHFFSACSNKGARATAYVNRAVVDHCAGVHRVGSIAECTTEGINGIVYDLMGGVGEWEDSCTDDGRCRVRGGMFGGGDERGRCDQPGNHQFGETSRMIGFRCCMDLGQE